MQVNIALTFDIHFAQSVEKCVKELEVVGCGNVKLESQPALCQRPAGLGPLQNCYLRRLCMSPSTNRSLNCRDTLSQVVCQYL